MAAVDLSSGALAPPPGVTPNFENPPNRNGVAIGAYTLMVAVATFSIGVRIYGKGFLVRQFQLEDGLIGLGYVSVFCHF